VAALGLMTARWELERQHRAALVEILNHRCACWWCRLRRFVSRGRNPEDVSATRETES
jgi:hypothetical protein